ncbi:hypothetical protein [Pedobacter mendelii]|uniref:Uncharacterized protein n=1 Tax=Pedobacter mendelii TaxID=1908240 RepID=A0ABQ2BH82_9SPHI|nr:hypothetical protein [Pedobacter mendelii]GGI24022.1 hypothetical protein GCM10008119_10580 [Pedobacter mendelii]
MNEPTITDWISAIGTLLGIPAIIFGIFQLFRKDKNLEKQVNSLESLAKSQNDVVNKMTDEIQELSRQTSEFQFQTEHMRDANDIAKKHLEIINEQFLQNKVTTENQVELQRLERLSKIKPHFTFSGGMSSPERFQVSLLNKGNTAKNIEIIQVDNELAKFNILEKSKEIDNNKKLEITGYSDLSKTYFNSNQVPFDVELIYENEDGIKYKQKLTRQNQTYNLTNPELLEIN